MKKKRRKKRTEKRKEPANSKEVQIREPGWSSKCLRRLLYIIYAVWTEPFGAEQKKVMSFISLYSHFGIGNDEAAVYALLTYSICFYFRPNSSMVDLDGTI